MIPWIYLDTAPIPDGAGTLKLMQRGGEFSIMANTRTLMNSRTSSSETALARLACARMRHRHNCSLLVGGYGMGFTLRAALAALGADARILVAELVPTVMAWAKGPMAGLTAGCLDDPRVTIHEGDVGHVIASGQERFDVIVLDVDNGPGGFSRRANDRLYEVSGLIAVRKALRPNGVLTVWSAEPDPEFTRRLSRAGFAVEETRVRASKGRGSWHTIWIAEKTASG